MSTEQNGVQGEQVVTQYVLGESSSPISYYPGRKNSLEFSLESIADEETLNTVLDYAEHLCTDPEVRSDEPKLVYNFSVGLIVDELIENYQYADKPGVVNAKGKADLDAFRAELVAAIEKIDAVNVLP